MSLIEAKLMDVTMSQYAYKLKAYLGLFFSLILAQMIGLLLSMGGIGGSSTHTEGMSISVNTYAGDIIIVFTMIWAFIVAILFTTKVYRDIDFTFVSNRLSSNLSSIGFLITTSFVGAVATMLLTIVHKVILYFYMGSENIASYGFLLAPSEVLLGFFAIALYMLLMSSVGYFVGIVAQRSKMFVVLLPSLLLGSIILEVRSQAQDSMVIKVGEFYLFESSLTIFAIKVIVTAFILFVGATLLSNRLEVRK